MAARNRNPQSAIRNLVAASCLVGLTAAPAAAQAVRGQLVDRSNGRPITGGFVVLLNEQEQEIARTLTDTQGRFIVRAPNAGAYRLQSKRIGFRISTSPPFQLVQDQILSYRLEVDAVPATLPPVVVEGRPQCGTRGEAGSAVARLWEETREALAAVSWTAGQRALRYDLRMYERDYPEIGERVTREHSWSRSGYAETPFRSAPAQQLADAGYVVSDDQNDRTYYAPDANVLLSDVFLDTHCFTARPGDGPTSGMVGLAFTPAPGRHAPDVEGVLWVDRQTAELRHMDFRYVKLPFGLPEGPVGGHLQFLRLPSGAWIVLDWWIHMPVMARVVYTQSGRQPEPKVMGFRRTGGQVLTITSPNGAVHYAAEAAIVEGTVHDSTRGAGLRGAEVFLAGTDYGVKADQRGAFQLTVPLNGEYGVSFRHARLDSIGYVPEPVAAVLQSGRRTTVAVAIPPEWRIVPRLCPQTELADSDRVMVGAVRDRAGRAIPSATVRVAWQSVTGTGGALRANDFAQVATTDSSGAFVICGVPPALVTVSARTDTGSIPPLILRFTDEGVWIGNRYRSFPGRIWTQDLTLAR